MGNDFSRGGGITEQPRRILLKKNWLLLYGCFVLKLLVVVQNSVHLVIYSIVSDNYHSLESCVFIPYFCYYYKVKTLLERVLLVVVYCFITTIKPKLLLSIDYRRRLICAIFRHGLLVSLSPEPVIVFLLIVVVVAERPAGVRTRSGYRPFLVEVFRRAGLKPTSSTDGINNTVIFVSSEPNGRSSVWLFVGVCCLRVCVSLVRISRHHDPSRPTLPLLPQQSKYTTKNPCRESSCWYIICF